MQEMARFLVLVSFLVLLSYAPLVLSANSVLVCPNLTGEPTISELVNSLVGNDTTNEMMQTLETQGLMPTADAILKWSFPVASLFSDGRFTITYDQVRNPFTFNDIHFVYKRNWFVDFSCSNEFVNNKLSFLCDCDGGLWSTHAKFGLHCVKSALCSDKTLSEGRCTIAWNPFQEGCLMINIPIEMDASSEALIRQNVDYQRVTPVLYDWWVYLAGKHNPFSSNSSRSSAIHALHHEALANIFDTYLVPTMKHIPVYGLNLVLGYVVVTNARDLTDHGGAQLLLQVVYGLFLAFIVLAYLLYR